MTKVFENYQEKSHFTKLKLVKVLNETFSVTFKHRVWAIFILRAKIQSVYLVSQKYVYHKVNERHFG